MPILFSAVAHNQNIVADFASCDGNFTEIIQQVISKLPVSDGKMTYYHGPYLIHYIMEKRHLYFCITNKLCQRSRAFLFLNEIHRRFLAQGKDDFAEVLASQMYTYSEDYSTITIRKGELDELNTIGVESSESILGEKVLFVNNPDNITYAVSYFKPLSTNRDFSTLSLYTFPHFLRLSNGFIGIKYCDKTVSYVGKSPEHISITVENSIWRLHVIVMGVLIIIIGAFYVLGPMSCAVLTGVLGCSFIKRFGSRDKKSE